MGLPPASQPGGLMATERLSMRSVREIFRQKWVLKKSHRQVARSLGISPGAVGSTMVRAQALGLSWAEVEPLSEEALEERLYGPKLKGHQRRPLPDPVYLHNERKKPGVTLELLHLEYLEQHPDGYRYSQFCEYFRDWLAKHRLSMRQVHRAGEKLFVAVLGASNYTFAEATRTQRGADFIQSHVHAFSYFEGVASAVVPDQLKSGVTIACRYEPFLQRTYEEMARHYGTAILPARPWHPKDKAKVEVAVQIAERWILARLRHETFFSLEALNERIAILLEELNHRRMRLYGASRRELYERLDKPALHPLPEKPFVYAVLGVNYFFEWMTIIIPDSLI